MSQYFEKYFDTIFVISEAAREQLGEDSFYCAKCKSSAIVSVYDGCGGLGARKYDVFKNHTGAYIASRIVSGALRDWYHECGNKGWKCAEDMLRSIERYIQKGYEIGTKYSVEKTRIQGSMVRKFPTTMALAYVQEDRMREGILLHILWAGDSRVYLLDGNGLAQLTMDDTGIEDAFENLTSDGVLTNVLSSDGNYKIHCKTIHLKEPALVFAATDGCFGYISSPMEFEHVILKSLIDSSTPMEFKKQLRGELAEAAGDDLALGLLSLGYGDFEKTRKSFMERLEYLEKHYISILRSKKYDEWVETLWKKYKPEYERYLR